MMELSAENTSALSAAISALCALISLGFSIYTVRKSRRSERVKNRPRIIIDLVKTGVQRDIYAESRGFSRRERKGRKAHAAQSTCLRSLTR